MNETELIDALIAMSEAFDIGQEATPSSAIGKCRAVLARLTNTVEGQRQ